MYSLMVPWTGSTDWRSRCLAEAPVPAPNTVSYLIPGIPGSRG